MSIFKDKVLLITGGTGSFGNAVLRRFLDSDIREIRIFSRDEKKQDDMRHFLQANRSDVANKVKFYIGNVRNREAVDFAMRVWIMCSVLLPSSRFRLVNSIRWRPFAPMSKEPTMCSFQLLLTESRTWLSSQPTRPHILSTRWASPRQ